MVKKCLICGVEDNSVAICPHCGTLMIPKRKKFGIRKLQQQEVESESKICFGMWTVTQYEINRLKIWTCNCPSFIKNGDCKHIRRVIMQETQETQETQDRNQQQDSNLTAEEILESILGA